MSCTLPSYSFWRAPIIDIKRTLDEFAPDALTAVADEQVLQLSCSVKLSSRPTILGDALISNVDDSPPSLLVHIHERTLCP